MDLLGNVHPSVNDALSEGGLASLCKKENVATGKNLNMNTASTPFTKCGLNSLFEVINSVIWICQYFSAQKGFVYAGTSDQS